MLNIELKPVETSIFHSDVVFAGTFRCRNDHSLFRNSGACNSNTIVFPQTAMVISRSKKNSFVADPNTLALYNRGDEYTRQRISPADSSDWYVAADDLLYEMIAARNGGASVKAGRPFSISHVYGDSRLYFAQRRLFESIRGGNVDRTEIEEGVVSIIGQALDQAFGPARALPLGSPHQRATVDAVRSYLNDGPAEDVGLRKLAEVAGCSPFHLCRLFRCSTGQTLTAYRHSLRMRYALRLVRTSPDLSDIAFSLGYSSHSHFSRVFRKAFGATPSEYRLTGRAMSSRPSSFAPLPSAL